jgi:hypothetical protein
MRLVRVAPRVGASERERLGNTRPFRIVRHLPRHVTSLLHLFSHLANIRPDRARQSASEFSRLRQELGFASGCRQCKMASPLLRAYFPSPDGRKEGVRDPTLHLRFQSDTTGRTDTTAGRNH